MPVRYVITTLKPGVKREDYEKWLSQAGCVDVKSITDLPYEHGLITGTKK